MSDTILIVDDSKITSTKLGRIWLCGFWKKDICEKLTTTTDDRHQVMAIAHMALKVR
jgi:hypothetical protein